MDWMLRVRRGEEHPAATLSNSDAREIREKYAEGGVTMQELARQYGVTKMCVSYIVRGLRHNET